MLLIVKKNTEDAALTALHSEGNCSCRTLLSRYFVILQNLTNLINYTNELKFLQQNMVKMLFCNVFLYDFV